MLLPFKSQHCRLTVFRQLLCLSLPWLVVLSGINTMSTVGMHVPNLRVPGGHQEIDRHRTPTHLLITMRATWLLPVTTALELWPAGWRARENIRMPKPSSAWEPFLCDIPDSRPSSRSELPFLPGFLDRPGWARLLHFWALPLPGLIVLNCESPSVFSMKLDVGRSSTLHRWAPRRPHPCSMR